MKKHKKKIIILSVVGVIVLLGVVGFLQMRARLEQMSKTAYDIVAAQRGTVEVKVKGAGTVEPLFDNTVYANFAGSVKQVYVQDGDRVNANNVIAVFESSALISQRDTLLTQLDEADAAIAMVRSTSGSTSVNAPVGGLLKTVFGQAGDAVDAVMELHGALAVISPDELMEVTLRHADGLMPMDKVTVTVDTKSAKGTVYSIREGHAVVRFYDDGFSVDDTAVVTSEDGERISEGAVAVANPVMVTARGGIISRVHKSTGSDVSRGTKLLSLEGEILSAQLYTQIEQRQSLRDELDAVLEDLESLTVRAGTDGVVSGLDLSPNQTVQEGKALFGVQSSDQIKIDVQIDEIDIANIETGEMASVSFDALSGETYQATVTKINPIGVSENNVARFTVTLLLENVPSVMIGMSADVEIISQRAENALLIPVEAIQIIGKDKYVALENDVDEATGTANATHKVETGVTDGVNIEITQGISEGDRVAVPQVRSSGMQMWNFGGGGGGTQPQGTPR